VVAAPAADATEQKEIPTQGCVGVFKMPEIEPVSVTPKEYALTTGFAPLNEPLGAIAIEFANLEDKLTVAINFLLKIDHIPDGLALEDLMQSFATRRKLFGALASLKTAGDLKENAIGKGGIDSRLMACNDIRNDLIHGRWNGCGSDENGNWFQKVRYHAEPTGLHMVKTTLKVTIPQLWERHATIFDTTLQLATWTHVFQHQDRPELWPPSWRGKSVR
jgi:hypothetical protein